MSAAIAVPLLSRSGYDPAGLDQDISGLLEAAEFSCSRGDRVLVKPNLLKAGQQGLICTHPQVVRAACARLLDMSAKVTVGDSPAFGSARSVARNIGLEDALRPLGVPIVTLNRPRRLQLPFGYFLGVSALALEQDRIVNLPKLKAHCQMRLTLAVKNLFGCVCGVRKAVAHTRHGDQEKRFEALFLELMEALPPSFHILDGIAAMHVKGPGGGERYDLGLLGASQSAVALDTAVYAALRLQPDFVPLWAEAQRRGLDGSRLQNLTYPLELPNAFPVEGFRLPDPLDAQTFHPVQLAWSAVKRMAARLG